MIEYRKNDKIKSKEQAEQLLQAMTDFATTGQSVYGRGMPKLDPELTVIWNDGSILSWTWVDETQGEYDRRVDTERQTVDQIVKYQSDLELWKNEKVRPVRNALMTQWFDSLRSKPELWVEQSEDTKQEALTLRQTLKDWPATFTEYVADSEIEARKPDKPSYITV